MTELEMAVVAASMILTASVAMQEQVVVVKHATCMRITGKACVQP